MRPCGSLCALVLQGRAHFQALVEVEDVPALLAKIAGSRVEQQARKLPPPVKSGAPPDLYYNLSIGSGSSAERLARQRDAIDAELRHPRHAHVLAAMPYHLRTVPSKGYCPAAIETRVSVSRLRSPRAPGAEAVLMGVFPKHSQPAVSTTLALRDNDAARKARSVQRTGQFGGPPDLAGPC